MRRRKYDRGEARWVRVNAQLRENLDDPRALRAYAEELRARRDPEDDPLGEVIQLALSAEAHEAELARAAKARGERWWGYVACRARKRCDELIRKHWHEWFDDVEEDQVDFQWRHGLVRRASLGPNVLLRSLGHLLSAPPMRFVEALDAGEYFGRIRWLASCECLREVVVPVTSALERYKELSRFGAGLTLTGSLRELRTWRGELERVFPGVKLRPRLPEPTIDSFYVGPRVTTQPRFAARPGKDTRVFRFCGACAREETTLLFTQVDDGSSHRSVTYEYECRECGHFTHYSFVQWEPEFPKRRAKARKSRTVSLAPPPHPCEIAPHGPAPTPTA